MWQPRVEKGASRSGKDTLFLPTLKAPARRKLVDRPQSAIGPKSDAEHFNAFGQRYFPRYAGRGAMPAPW